MSTRSLVDQSTELTVTSVTSEYTTAGISATLPAANGLQDILKIHLEVLSPFSYLEPIRHNVVHRIQTTGSPVYSSPRRLHTINYKQAKNEFQHMLQFGIIRPSSIAHGS